MIRSDGLERLVTRKNHNWDKQKLDEIADLIEAGHTVRDIANRFDASVGAVAWQILRLGVVGPRSKRGGAQPRSYVRAGRTVRSFTEEEDRLIIDLEAEGLSVVQIAKRLGRRHNSVIGRLATLARHDAIAEEEALSGPPGLRE